MAFDYAEARETAESIIREFGQAGQCIKKGTTGGVDFDGNVTPDTPDIIIDGIASPILPLQVSFETVGSNIQAGDAFFFFHSDTAPEIGFQHTQNGRTLRIVSLLSEITSNDGINTYRKFQLRV